MAGELQRVWLSAGGSDGDVNAEVALRLSGADLVALADVAAATGEPRVMEHVYAQWLNARAQLAHETAQADATAQGCHLAKILKVTNG